MGSQRSHTPCDAWFRQGHLSRPKSPGEGRWNRLVPPSQSVTSRVTGPPRRGEASLGQRGPPRAWPPNPSLVLRENQKHREAERSAGQPTRAPEKRCRERNTCVSAGRGDRHRLTQTERPKAGRGRGLQSGRKTVTWGRVEKISARTP